MSKEQVKEVCFTYRNKKHWGWLKIERHFNIYSESYDYRHEAYDSFHRSVLYSARNIIEKDFSKIKLEDREDWELMQVDIAYNYTAAKRYE
jgi:hypothetical protein